MFKQFFFLAFFVFVIAFSEIFSQEESPYGKVLTLDSSGTQGWIYVWDLFEGRFWSLNGNSINSGEFLGTTNGEPLVLRVNNLRAMSFFSVSGEVNIVGGHPDNYINSENTVGSVIAGGGSVGEPNVIGNEPSGSYSFVGAGTGNNVSSLRSGIVAGELNYILAQNGFIGAGQDNSVFGSSSGIMSGILNQAGFNDGDYYGNYSGILGGFGNFTRGDGSMAIGNFLTTNSYSEIVLGLYNSNEGYDGDLVNYQNMDRLLVVGNGFDWDNQSNSLVMLKNGKTALGSNVNSSPTSLLDLQGTNGYEQLRLRASYTPTDSDDPNGEIGDVAWDDNYFYVKTSSGWKRVALSSW